MKNTFKGFNYEKIPLPVRRFINTCIGFHFFGYPYKKLKIIGVTGTSGKTTTTTLLYRIATTLGYKAGLIGTVENFISGEKIPEDFYKKGAGSAFEKIFFSSTGTTPEVWQLNKLLSKMENERCEYVFLEVSSHGLEERRVSRLKFSGAIFTNLTHDHLDFHKNMKNYFLAKRKLFKMLSPDAFALANTDDEYGNKMLQCTRAQKYSYGFQECSCQRLPLTNECQGQSLTCFHGKIEKLDFNGLGLDFNGEKVQSKLIGKFNAYNLLAVWSACKLLGFDIKKVKEILQNIEPPRGRFEHFMSPSGVLIIVDYAHKPDALENVLRTIAEIKEKNSRVISVFGCGGDRDSLKRPIMGKIGVSFSDIAIFTSDNPRSEDPEKIIAQMKIGLSREEIKKVKIIKNRHEAILEAVKLAKMGDVIICAGKGHEDYQEIKGVKNHFNDMEELKSAFANNFGTE